MPRPQRALFDPAAWAESRRLKIAKAEKLREMHRKRMGGIDACSDAEEYPDPCIGSNNSQYPIRQNFDFENGDDSPDALTALFDHAYMNKEGNYRYDDHKYIAANRENEENAIRSNRLLSSPVEMQIEACGQENEPAAGDLWRGMLRDHDDYFQSDDPLVFGKPKKNPLMEKPKVRKQIPMQESSIPPVMNHSSLEIIRTNSQKPSQLRARMTENAHKSSGEISTRALDDRPYSGSSRRANSTRKRPASGSRPTSTPSTSSYTASRATPRPPKAEGRENSNASAKGFLPVGLQKQLDRRHCERKDDRQIRLPRIPSSMSDGENSERHQAAVSSIHAVRAKKRARSMPRKKDDDEKCFRQMFDKNTLRLMHRQLFMDALLYRTEIKLVTHERGDVDVKVLIRKRPMFAKEMEADFDIVSTTSTSCTLSNCLFQADLKVPFFSHNTFHVDNVFGENASNLDVYRETQDVVNFAVSGGLGTMFMLGQTGSGKTHTMTAIEEFAAKDLFRIRDLIGVHVSFLEVRANKVYDLLDSIDDREVKLRAMANGTYATEDAISFMCQQADELIGCVREGHDRRATQSTEANDTSSRSHALCVLTIETIDGMGGKLVLVDCAGTERRKDSMHHSKERQAEGAHINASLHALKECIRIRAEKSYVPSHVYRASALTKLLAEAFSVRDGKLLVICTVSPCATDTEHSMTTLRTGFSLSGRPKNCMVEERQGDLKELVFGKPKRAHPMNRWSQEEVSVWLQNHGLEGLVPPGTTGHMLVRMPESRFAQVLGPKKGRRMFDLVREEIERSAGRK